MVAAKASGLAMRLLYKRLPAVAALILFRLCPAANGFDRVHGQAELAPDLAVGQPLAAQG